MATEQPFATATMVSDNISSYISDNITSDDSCPEEMHAEYPSTMLGITATCAFIIAILGTCGNLLTIVAIPQNKKLRTSSTAFVMNLAFAELLFCIFILPLSGVNYLYIQYGGADTPFISDGACVFFTTVRYTITQAELQTVLAIAVTRAIAVSAPNLYIKLNTLSATAFYIVGIWVYSFVIRIPIASGVFGRYAFNKVTMECDVSNDLKSMGARKVYNLIEVYIPVLLIIFLYIFVFIMVIWRNRVRKKRFHSSRLHSKSASGLSSKKVRCSTRRVEKQAAKSRRPTLASVSSDPSSPATPYLPNSTIDRKTSNKSLARSMSDQKFKFPRRKSGPNLGNKRDMRVARTVFVIFLMIVICSIPVGIEHSTNKYCVKKPNKFLMMHILYWVQYCLNLFVYVLMNKQYRDAYVEYLSKFIPGIQSQKGKRFFWENPSTISTKPADMKKGSCQGGRKDSGIPPEIPGTPKLIKNQGKFLSAIVENHNSSIADDDVFEETDKNNEEAHHPEEKLHMLSENNTDL